MDYDLTRLGWREFEHLTQALALKVLGARLGVFGDGPDGGREAAYRGKATWTGSAEPVAWDGHLVVQAKYRQRIRDVGADARWFVGQVKDELDRWSGPDSRRRRKGRLPDYLLLSTNVVLSSTVGGGIDQVDRLLTEYAEKLGLKDWHVWHHDQISRMLDDAADIRAAFSGLITPGDVLAQLHEMLLGQPAELGRLLTTHAAKDLLAEQWIRLGQAGDPGNERLTLDQVAIDLVAIRRDEQGQPETVPAVAHIVKHGDRILRRSTINDDLVPHIVLVGGPGQGKTTLGQLVTQTYRAALLADSTTLGPDVTSVVRSNSEMLSGLEIPRPNNRRWPIRIDLATYGDAIAGGEDLALLRWIAKQVTARAGNDVSGSQIKSWLRNWPWLLVLDGLDEVASAHAREHLMDQLNDFMIDAADLDADLLIVITTRPQGYSRELDDRRFAHLSLEPLSPDDALRYATRLADVRHRDDPDLRGQTLQRVADAASEQMTARLMRTPLQVTIMSLLLERRPRPPRDRHGLFEAYYDTIYAREAAKPGNLAKLLAEHKADVDALHAKVGLRLQVLSEGEGDSDASIPSSELHSLAMARLQTEGHSEGDSERLAGDIVKAAMYRLVLLVPKADRDVGFEVRSLQEFMAARAVATGPDNAVLQRLRLLAPAIHWRNTWLLAAGRVFTAAEHLRSQVIALLREIDAEDVLSSVVPVGPELALDLLDDDLAARSPQYRRQLLVHALEILDQPPSVRFDSRAATLNDLAGSPDLRPLIIQALEHGINASADQRATTWLVLQALDIYTGALAARARQLKSAANVDPVQLWALTAWDGRLDRDRTHLIVPADTGKRRLSEYLAPGLNTTGLTGTAPEIATSLLDELHKTVIPTLPPDHVTCLPPVTLKPAPSAIRAINDPELAEALSEALVDIPAESWAASAVLRLLLRGARQRRPVGAGLADLGDQLSGTLMR